MQADPPRKSLSSIIEELRDFDTALVANTIGYIDPTPAHEYYMGGSIACLTPALGPTVGIAMTCEVDTSTPGAKPEVERYYELLKAIEASAEPVVRWRKPSAPGPITSAFWAMAWRRSFTASAASAR